MAAALGGQSKVLFGICGATVLERNLRWLSRSGITSVWINLHYRPADIRAVAGDGTPFGLTVRYSEEPELLGTAGTFRALAGSWTNTALVVYGDNVSEFDLGALLEQHRRTGAVATIALFDQNIHANSGIAGGRVVVEDEGVVRFTEGAQAGSASSLVNAGVYALEPAVLQYVPDSPAPDFGKDVFPALLAAGCRVTAHIIEPAGYCFGLDTPESLRRTQAFFDGVSRRSE